MNFSVHRSHKRRVQEQLHARSVQEDRRGGSAVAAREGPRLHHHLPNTQHPSAVHAPFRPPSIGLQRSPLHLRWRARGQQLQGKSPPFHFYVGVTAHIQ